MSATIRKKFICTAMSLAAWVTCASAQDLNPNPEFRPGRANPLPEIKMEPTNPLDFGSPVSTRPKDELAMRIYQARLERGLIEDPYLYKSLKTIFGSPTEVRDIREIRNWYWQYGPVLRSSAQRKGTTRDRHDDCCPQQHGSSPAPHEPLLRLSGKPTTSHSDPSVGRPRSECELVLSLRWPGGPGWVQAV
jgi:hypothetical protein